MVYGDMKANQEVRAGALTVHSICIYYYCYYKILYLKHSIVYVYSYIMCIYIYMYNDYTYIVIKALEPGKIAQEECRKE